MGPNIDILTDLLQKGASVHTRNNGEQTPLELAIDKNSNDYISELERAGAHSSPTLAAKMPRL